MAIYSCNVSNVSRAKGSSSCATLAYISGEKILEERTGKTHQYGRQDRIVETGTIIPQSAPIEFQNPKNLFNAIENFEKASNARTAVKIMLALPKELETGKQKEVIENYIKKIITPKNYACTYAIHHDKEGNNPHTHILIANRQINEKGEWSIKSRKEYALDENGERIPQLDENGNQKLGKRNTKLWKRISVQVNPLDTKEMLCELRKQWASECNKYLAPELQIDHRSYAEQGKEQEPTIHEGYKARKIEAQGGISERCEINREITARNSLFKQIKQIQAEIKNLTEKATTYAQEKGEKINDRFEELLKRRARANRANNKSLGRSTDGERAITDGEQADIIREARTSIDSSRAKEQDSGASRANREATRERQAIAEKQATLDRSQSQTIRESEIETRSRGLER